MALATAARQGPVDRVPYRSMHDPTDVLAGALLGTGWRAVTVDGIPGVRHHQLRAETPGENPETPAHWWPLPCHG